MYIGGKRERNGNPNWKVAGKEQQFSSGRQERTIFVKQERKHHVFDALRFIPGSAPLRA
jgi:hypothetical protein